MREPRKSTLSAHDGIPYPEIYQTIHKTLQMDQSGEGDKLQIQESGPLCWENPGLLRLFRRLGTVSTSASPAKASLRILLAAQEMAQSSGKTVEDVYRDLEALTDSERETAVCVESPRCGECPLTEYCDYPSRRPTIKDLPPDERPRERLLAAGAESLTTAELLAILIGSGSNKETALGVARQIVSRFDTLKDLWSAGDSEVMGIKGIGSARLARIRAALELGKRFSDEPIRPGMTVKGSKQVFEHFRDKCKDLKKEAFMCLLLDTKHNVIREEQIAIGSLNESVVHPREVFRDAISESAAAVLFVHNHPSGDPTPSPQDKQLTRRLVKAGSLVGIKVLDHVVVGHDTYYSFAEQGKLKG